MKPLHPPISRQSFAAPLLMGLLAAVLLLGCGGGGSTSAQAGATGTQVASGVVTGFGSVFVDGVEIEDANARVTTENYDGTLTNSVLQMGHRVRVAHDGKGTASAVTLDAALIGTVQSAPDTTANTLTVAGQKIKMVVDTTVGTLTVWGGGYSSLSDVAANDLVEVHGTPVYDNTNKIYTVTATRIQKVTANTGRMQVAGSISALDTSAKIFALNGLTVNYTSAALRPTGAVLANGTEVTAYAPVSAFTNSTMTMAASHLKVNRLQDSTLAVSAAQIGGLVSKYDASGKTFEVQGVKVSIGSTTTINPNGKTVADGAYVNVSGSVGSDGRITATNIQVREQNTSSDLATVKLIGVISDYVNDTSFVVRGVPVDASGIVLSASCPGLAALANGQEVSITATQQSGTAVVLATTLSCKAQSSVVIRPVDGTASNVDAAAKTFTLTLTGATTTQTVQWNDATTFVGVTATTLASTSVRVEGYLSGRTLVARNIMARNSSIRLDDRDFHAVGGNKDAAKATWDNYRRQKSSNHNH
ncbi:DUF5666 domain-containing protein [Limnohabitans sp.]|uniref:DUF5666 domain-containing protein n=1 Tax=Limnohabitans sp. TaxID=1907725 RepID=UPI00286ECEED|nr:DUF5666 domain-containing protein [Limnohabitans sp.]